MNNPDRDCKNCEHYKWFVNKNLVYKKRFQACEAWSCDFKAKEKSGDGQENTRN